MFASGALAAIAFVLALMLRRHKRAPKTQVLLMLLAGFGLGGVLGHLLAKAGALISHLGTVGTAKLLGVAVPAIVVIALLFELIMQLHPKNKSPHRSTVWLALLLPAVLATAGGVWAGLGVQADSVLSSLGTGAEALASSLATGW